MTLSRVRSPLDDELEQLVQQVIGSCLTVHSSLGPGLMEVVYTGATCVELAHRSIPFEREKLLPVMYRGNVLCHQRVDILVDRRVVVEVKSVDRLHPIHIAQTVNYVRLTGTRVGLIVNFNTERLRYGIRRVVV